MGRKFLDKNGGKHVDDPTISDEDGLLRRMPAEYWRNGEVSSVAFGPEGISCCLESLISQVEFHNEYPCQGLIRLHAGKLRGEREVLERDPSGDTKSTLAHALSWGKRSKTNKKRLKRMAKVLYMA